MNSAEKLNCAKRALQGMAQDIFPYSKQTPEESKALALEIANLFSEELKVLERINNSKEPLGIGNLDYVILPKRLNPQVPSKGSLTQIF